MMDGERKSCTERILSAIEYGKLPNDETERRLCELIEAEVNKTDSAADMELMKACQSLLWQLHTHGRIPYESHYNENKAQIDKHIKREALAIKTAKSVGRMLTAAAAIVFVIFGLRGDLQWRWLEQGNTYDQQQHIITGNEIGVELIQNAIAEYLDIGRIRVTTPQELAEYISFVPIPQTLNETWKFASADVTVTSGFISIDARYSNAETQSVMMCSTFLFTDVEEAYFTFEQSAEGSSVTMNGHHVYVTRNMHRMMMCWTEGLVFVRVAGEFQEQEGLSIAQYLLEEWNK